MVFPNERGEWSPEVRRHRPFRQARATLEPSCGRLARRRGIRPPAARLRHCPGVSGPGGPLRTEYAGRSVVRIAGEAPVRCCCTSKLTSSVSRKELNFTLDLDRNVEGKLGHPYCASRVSSALLAKDGKYEFCEAVDDCGLSVEPGCRIHHAEYSRPASDAFQASKLALEAAQNGQPSKASRHKRLFLCDLATNLAQRFGKRAVCVRRPMARNESSITRHPHPWKRKRYAGREPQWLRDDVAKCVQAIFDARHAQTPDELWRQRLTRLVHASGIVEQAVATASAARTVIAQADVARWVLKAFMLWTGGGGGNRGSRPVRPAHHQA